MSNQELNLFNIPIHLIRKEKKNKSVLSKNKASEESIRICIYANNTQTTDKEDKKEYLL
jgi:hypothetical protein